MPTVLRWGPYRAFFYSNERVSRRIFTFGREISKPSFGCTTSLLRQMRDFLHMKSALSSAT
jgi:hypothetical protein